MITEKQGYVFDGQQGSAMLLHAQIRAGQVFPTQMLAWMERHPLALSIPRKAPRNRQKPRVVAPPKPPVKLKIGQLVVDHVSRKTGASVSAIVGREQNVSIVAARRRVSRIMRRLGCSWNQIGRTLERDHATIINLLTPKVRQR